MAKYGVAEAKNRLSELLDAVAAGEIIEITRHGKTAGHIVPPDQGAAIAANKAWAEKRDAMLEKMRLLRESMPMSPISSVDLIRQMRDEGP